ncbi:MAG: DUF4367 domain-containing protein, partial [Bacillota bacterium]|nr:DUF4367 domain-containing protein [Bacillota bacterium]
MMTNNPDNKNFEDKALDLLLYQAIDEITNREMAQYREQAETMPDIPTPKLDKLRKNRLKREKSQSFLRWGGVAAALVIVLFGVHMLLYTNVEAYRSQFKNSFIQYDTGYGGFGSIDVADSPAEAGVVEVTAPVPEFPFKLWVPDDFNMVFISGFDVYGGYCEWQSDVDIINNKKENISFSYTLHENNQLGIENKSSMGFDTEDSEIIELTINGNEGIAIYRDYFGLNNYRVLWVDENYIFDVSGAFNKETENFKEIILKMARSVVYA